VSQFLDIPSFYLFNILWMVIISKYFDEEVLLVFGNYADWDVLSIRLSDSWQGWSSALRRTYSVIDEAKSLRLTNNCEIVFTNKRLQPVYTVVLDCPGKDSMRL